MTRRVGLIVLKRGTDRAQDALASIAAMLALLLVGEPSPTPVPRPPTGGGHVPTQTTEDGRIVTPDGVAPPDLSEWIREYWPKDVWSDAAWVSFHESGWRATAERNTLDQAGGRCNVPIGTLADGTPIVSEQSIGYFQINRCAHGYSQEHWQNGQTNVRYGAFLYAQSGWYPWVWTATNLGLIGRAE